LASDVNSSLQERLDAFVSGGCPPETFAGELSEFCRETSDSSWEALSLLDQYHRRGKLSGDQLRAFRRQVEFQALGIPEPVKIRVTRIGPAAPAESATPAEFVAPSVSASPAEPAAPPLAVAAPSPDADEVRQLRIALASEREKSQQYRKRIATLAKYGRRQRSSLSEAQRIARETAQRAALETAQRNEVETGQRPSLVAALPDPVYPRPIPQARPFSSPRLRLYAALIAAALIIAVATSGIWRTGADTTAAGTAVEVVAPAVPVSAPVAPGTISLSGDRYVVFPGRASVTIQVDRAGDASGAVSFLWWAEESGAKPGKDYVFKKARVARMNEGERSVQLTVQLLANPQRKHTELFYVVIGRPEGAALGSVRRAAVIIMRPDAK
jgi:hypothetical protein